MMEQRRIKLDDIFMMWGIILVMLGVLGIIQMGLLEQLSDFIFFGLILMVIGVIILFGVIFVDKYKSK